MSPATARWVRLISRNARIAKVNVASSAMARRLPTSTIAMSSLPMVYQLYAPTSFAANRSTLNPLQRKTSSPLLARIRVMTLEPLRRHTGEEQRLYRPHPKYGANRALHRPGLGRGARRRGAPAEGIHLARSARRSNRGNENPDAESALR